VTDEQAPKTNGVKWWVQLFLDHFWKIIVIVVLIAWIAGWLPLPEPKEILDFLKSMKE